MAPLLFSPHFCMSACGEGRPAVSGTASAPMLEIEIERTVGYVRNGHGGNRKRWYEIPAAVHRRRHVCMV